MLALERVQHEVQLQQAAPAAPTDTVQFRHAGPPVLVAAGQTARLSMISLILPMARVGLSPLGQTSTQFMIEWQRNSR